MTEYFDGPGFHSAEHFKGSDSQNTRRIENENRNLSEQVDSLKLERLHLREDLKRANTDLLQYKDRTQALQKQVNGLKSGKYKPDQVPEFKTLNPNQQIIKALIKENDELKKRIELLKEIKDKVKTNAASMDQSDLYDALTYLEEENKNLRSQLNLSGEVSQHSLIGKENENVEISQLKEKLQISLNWSRDLSDYNEILKKELEKALENMNTDFSKPIVRKDPPMECISRTIEPSHPQSTYPYAQQIPMHRPPGRIMDPIPFKQYPVPGYLEHSPLTPNRQDYYSSPTQMYHAPALPPAVIIPPPPPGASALHQQEQQKRGGPHPYNPQGPNFGYN